MSPLLWVVGYLAVGFVVAVLIGRFDRPLGSDAPPFILLWPFVILGVTLWALCWLASEGVDFMTRRLP